MDSLSLVGGTLPGRGNFFAWPAALCRNESRKQRFLNNFNTVRQKLKDIEEKDRIRNFQPPVDGEEIMRIFELTPCREVGTLKSCIKDAILDGKIPNEHDAAYEFMLKKAAEMGLTPKQ